MRLLHTADQHLGFRQFSHVGPDGRNVRETDVMSTFRTFVDRAIALAPDVIVIAGDVFHSVRPSNGCIDEAFGEFSRLMQALPATVAIVGSGNHDLPRSADTGCILRLFARLGIHVVERDPTRLSFPALNLSVLVVPDAPQTVRPSFVPDPAARYNIVVLHGEVQGMLKHAFRPEERACVEIPIADMQPAAWDYIALGHYHVYRELAPNCFYSGSIDFTSTNPWGEIEEARERGVAGKGFAERNLDTGEQIFHPLPASRAYVDLPTFSAHELNVEDVDHALRAAIEACPGSIDGKVVRLVVTDLPREISRELDHKALREYKRRALNLNLTFRRPERLQFGTQRASGRQAKSVDEIAAAFFAERFGGESATAALARRYLDEATPLDQDTMALGAGIEA